MKHAIWIEYSNDGDRNNISIVLSYWLLDSPGCEAKWYAERLCRMFFIDADDENKKRV